VVLHALRRIRSPLLLAVRIPVLRLPGLPVLRLPVLLLPVLLIPVLRLRLRLVVRRTVLRPSLRLIAVLSRPSLLLPRRARLTLLAGLTLLTLLAGLARPLVVLVIRLLGLRRRRRGVRTLSLLLPRTLPTRRVRRGSLSVRLAHSPGLLSAFPC